MVSRVEGEGSTIRLGSLMALVLEELVPGSSRSRRADTMEAVYLIRELVGNVTVKDLGAHRPKYLAGQPCVRRSSVRRANTLASQFMGKIMESRLLT